MASGASAPPLTESAVRALLDDTPPTGPLPGVFLVLPNREDGSGLRALGTLIRVRAGGFMVALPDLGEVAEFLQSLTSEEGAEDLIAMYTTEVEMETIRGRGLQVGPCLLADVLWTFVGHFKKGHPLRNPSAYEVLHFTQGGTACRPRRPALLACSEQWIHEIMDDDTAGDYVTGEDEMWPEPAASLEDPLSPGEDVAAMQRRITQLEAVLQARPPPPPGGTFAQASRSGPAPPRGVLFGGLPASSHQVPPQDAVERLRALAGVAPVRLGAHERATREQRPERILESLQQEAAEPAELEEGITELEAAVSDPLQRTLVLQMKQMALLTRQQTQRQPLDPLAAALAGGSDGQNTGSGSVKGCAAREAYLKVMQDHGKVAMVVMDHACRELGLESSQVGPGLMKEYIEKKCPLGDNRLLTQQAYLWAFAWETGFRLNDVVLMGVASRGLLFIDQAATDYGKTNLAWLLTALPDPQFSIVQRNRHRQSLTPYSRLASASWVGANVAFMKDLDYLETKIKSTNNFSLTKDDKGGGEDTAPTQRKTPWKPKRKKKEESDAS